jgi:hypothetical protein
MQRIFYVAVAVAAACIPLVRAQAPDATPNSPGATFIPWLLQGKEELKQVPFSDVILYATGKKVLAIDRADETDQRVLKQLGIALEETLKRMNAADSPVQSVARVNEVSALFENMLREVLNNAEALTCEFAKTAGEKVQRSGYPDLQLTDDSTKRIYYLDPKLYAKGSRESSFRSFYFEPKVATNKVRADAVHLILGIEHEGRQAGHWSFTRWEIVDLAQFKVRLKAEFQGSNRDMYRPEAVVASGEAAKE